MSAPKYKQKPIQSEQELNDSQEVSEISSNINNLLKDPEKLKKAIKIIEEMISDSNK